MNHYHSYYNETQDLLNKLVKAGFYLAEASYDGYEYDKVQDDPDRAIDILMACDEGYLRVTKDSYTFTLFLVYGNGPGELVCDYSWPKEAEDNSNTYAELSAVIESHWNTWE